jgi:hypothetical protein
MGRQVNGILRLLLYAWRLLGPPAQIVAAAAKAAKAAKAAGGGGVV